MTPWNAHPPAHRLMSAALAVLMTLLFLHAPRASAGTSAPAPWAKASVTDRTKARAHTRHARQARSKSTTRPIVKAATTPVGSAGMRAAIDPVTGRLTRPTVQDIGGVEAQAGVRRAASEEDLSRRLKLETLPDGSEMVRLDERFHEFEVARMGADGKLQLDCVHGKGGVTEYRAKAAQAKPAAAPKREMQ